MSDKVLLVDLIGALEAGVARAGFDAARLGLSARPPCRCGCGRRRVFIIDPLTQCAAEAMLKDGADARILVETWLAAVRQQEAGAVERPSAARLN